MDQIRFQAADAHLDELAEIIDQMLVSPDLKKLRDTLTSLSFVLGERYSVSLSCLVDVYDSEREHALPLLNVGLSTSAGGPPYQIVGDSSPHRYIVDGEIQVVPHDRCPKCWGEWDFKWRHPRCEHCHTELGQNCKVLLDSDVCPYCERGQVTATQPKCGQCGFEVDPAAVVWG